MTSVQPIPAELWDQIPTAAQQALLVAFAQYELRLGQLQQQIASLEERLGQNSSNSSRPPSSDGPEVKPAPPRTPSGRRKGGQPGHRRSVRPLLPPTETFTRKPEACRRCGQPLAGEDPQPLRHQILELPKVEPVVLEYQLHRLSCPCCNITTCATLPEGTPEGGQGSRLQAVIALLSGAYRLSKRQVETLLADLFGVPVCAAQVCEIQQDAGEVLQPVVDELIEEVRKQPANMDETSWPVGKQRAWLWVAVTQYLTVYHLVASRGAKVVKHLLGENPQQVLTTDRFKAYSFLALSRRQLCWAHLRRDFQAMIDRDNGGTLIGRKLLSAANLVLWGWKRVRDGTGCRKDYRDLLQRWLRKTFKQWLHKGSVCACAKTAATCKELLALEPALWTFAFGAGVEPTNNAAERALRHAVLWRVSSHGTQSEAGSKYVANILSVVETCRQQGRNVLDYLTSAFQAVAHHNAPSSLLPVPKS